MGLATDVLNTVHDRSTAFPRRAEKHDDALYFQRCRWCGTTMFRRLLCPVCASTDLESERSEGKGVIFRSSVLNRNTPEARTVAVVQMAEGFTVRSRVLGPSLSVRPGARVRLAPTNDPERREIVFQVCDDLYGSWS
jgi:hypothetical protein